MIFSVLSDLIVISCGDIDLEREVGKSSLKEKAVESSIPSHPSLQEKSFG